MTSLLVSKKEQNLMLKMIDESMRLFGIDCTLYDISSMNMYLDDRILKSGVPYKVLMQDYVDTRLLSNLRWSTIDVNKESIIAFMPIQYCGNKFNIREFNVIKLCNDDLYQIREVNKAYLVGLWYVVKLITYKDEANRPREKQQMKSNYMNTLKEEIE